ncbi:hypothetical protein A8B79_13545 [Balneola sp. EhC07]|uniref:hypothetical protein n=1 Tax=Balneola sp. EhC07 TaxID=1849360 RepID=UPI0007F4D8F5|nr:hypothetical protein [Balneola sp. EhC07]OAN64358.1 hypothetical protein A8B79_13545 [Balneola sp. EhC07]
MKLTIKLIFALLIINSCSTKNKENEKELLLQADREAPIGWIYLRIYQDSTFEFESRGLRTSTVYKGKAKIDKYQISFNYNDSIPKAGSLAIYNKNTVYYTNGDYAESVGITLTKLDSSLYDRFSITEIRQVLQQAIDLKELQKYFHIDSDSSRKPLKIIESDMINRTTLMGVQKFNEPVSVISKNEADKSETRDYLSIGDWSIVNQKLSLQLHYPVEGITINYMFKKDSNKWVLIDSKLMEK